MSLGVPGTGPYGLIRVFRQEIKCCKYELKLIGMGMKRKVGAKRLNEIITANKNKIKEILAAEKVKK